MTAATEQRTCYRCGRRRPRLELVIASMGDAWAYSCIDLDACNRAGLAASKSRARSLLSSFLDVVGIRL